MKKVGKLLERLFTSRAEQLKLPVFGDEAPERRRVVFTGNVQQVGFRFETYMVVQKVGLTGWVKNRADGAVEAEFQGEPEKIRFVVQYLRSVKRANVTGVEERQIPLIAEERTFEITG